MSEIRVGQVYRERDKRFVRHITIIKILSDGRWQCGPCREDGLRTYGGRITKIKADTLRSRFELIRQR